ncbi:S-receptor-like serine/threonine-protein kinase protein [Dioscorea alata]|uniref:S-receptor-like serine/threonine-protein kinase protein n=1 Tax=Dioscorea alata TaxID=55571 RepID=A0ACB7UCD9_DIOAL|nr:S-receptor-like serine/threonine-protein kinase protein [Dioscorea alata]
MSLILLLLLLCNCSLASQTNQNISKGTTITITESWFSPSGDFAFGFLPLPTNSSLFLLAVWFNKTDDKTVVWSANGNFPVLEGSKLQLTTDGQFLLIDHTGSTVWNPYQSSGAAYAALLDTGNLILAATDSTPIWQSFKFPTDTILPTQVLFRNTTIRSHLYDHDYTDGKFELSLQSNGNLMMFPLALPTNLTYDAYWETNTIGSGTQLVFDANGTLYLLLNNGTRINITTSSFSTTAYYQRVTLDSDGVLRHYIHRKNGWTVVTSVPSDICNTVNSGTGSGACGFNSYCQLDENDHRSCLCPPSFSLLDPDKPYEGCRADYETPLCDGGDQSGMFEFKEMVNVDWPGSDYEHYNSFNESQCRENCLHDCFCAVAFSRGMDCWKKKLPLTNGRATASLLGKALIKVPNTSFSPSPPPQFPNTKKGRKVWLITGLLSLAVSLLILFGSIITLVRRSQSNHKSLAPDSLFAGPAMRCFTYKELEEATDGFKKELGRGAFGIVYEGFLPSEPKTCIAVKKLDRLLQEREKEFTVEVQSIGQTHHKNLVRLYGYCNEGINRLLVYEFMSNGSLMRFLFGSSRLGWDKRVDIAIGIARGLLYLHEECHSPIIHCDIKPQNILLDDELTPKISDFGLAKLLGRNQTQTNTAIRGTRGYVAAEWFKNMAISAKVDVYSYGVMLLEIICCRRSLQMELNDREEEAVLAYWAYDCYREGKVHMLVGNDAEALADFDGVMRFLMIAIWCIQEDPSQRPIMRRVNQMLDCAIVVPPPPSPYSSSERFTRSPDCYRPLLEG